MLERELEQRTQRREDTFLVPRSRPDAQLAVPLGEGVGEDQRSLLRQPERRLAAAAPLVEGDKPSGKLVPGLDRLELRLGDVVAPQQRWSTRTAARLFSARKALAYSCSA